MSPKWREALRGAQSPYMRHTLRLCELYAAIRRPVLLCGPVGVGKTTLARLMHEASGRTGELVAVSGGELTDTLYADGLFGHVQGAFTGSAGRREGAVARAARGTLLLDDIAYMPLPAQAAILRVMEDARFRPLGSDKDEVASCRFIFATTVPPEQLVEEGRLLPDLESRIGHLIVEVPALRHRKEDILPLAKACGELFAKDEGVQATIVLQEHACELLLAYPWPKNVRGLRSAMEYAVLHAGLRPGAIAVEARHLPDCIREHRRSAREEAPDVSLSLIESTLRSTGGCKSEAARQLRLHRNTIGNRLKAAARSSDVG